MNRDEIRRMFFDSSFDPQFEDLVTLTERNIVMTLLMSGFNVVIDATHIKPKYIQEWVMFLNTHCPHKLNIVVKPFDVDLNVALLRNAHRPAGERVPDYVIRRMYMGLVNTKLQ